MQIYAFAPLIIIPFTLNAKIGIIVSLIVFALSTTANFVTVFIYYYPATEYPLGFQDPRMTSKDYGKLMYCAAWIRCQIYIMGFLVGYFLHRTPKLKISRVSEKLE